MTPVSATAGSVMPDFKAVESRRVWEGRFGVFPDMPAQFALQDRFEECAHFVFLPRREKLHPAVAQIPDRAGHVEALRYMPDRIAEANALDIPLVKDLNRCSHAIARFIRRAATASAIYCPGEGAGRSGSGNSSGGGTRRGSSELRLNCSAAGEGGAE